MRRMLMAMSVVGILTVACSKNDDPAVNVQLQNTASSGSWQVSLFKEGAVNNTSLFTGFGFNFKSDKTVTATKSTVNVNGTWNTAYDDSKDKFLMDFGTQTTFNKLNEDWRVVSYTNNKLELVHVSGGNGTTDSLTFTK